MVTRNKRDFSLIPGLVIEDWNDPSIQAEIQQIEQEFKITEMDGLTDL
ncbi:MAG: hypothetical protein ACRC2M_16920 [Planktothrix sp.]